MKMRKRCSWRARPPRSMRPQGGPISRYPPPRPARSSRQARRAAAASVSATYYLYPLAERTTIANQQTKQVSFLDVHGVPAEHGYEFHNRWLGTADTPQSAKSMYRFSTSAHAGLGDQLPAGILRFYLRDKRGDPQFIGESRIDHTPMGSTLSLATGDAFDVKVRAVVEKRTRLSAFDWQSEMRYEFSNALPKPVTVKLLQEGLWGDSRITAESQKSTRRSAEIAEWAVTVPANGRAVSPPPSTRIIRLKPPCIRGARCGCSSQAGSQPPRPAGPKFGGRSHGSFGHRLPLALSRLGIDRSRSAARLCADQRDPHRSLARGHEPRALRGRGRWHRTRECDRDRPARRHLEKNREGAVAQPVRADGVRRRPARHAAAVEPEDRQARAAPGHGSRRTRGGVVFETPRESRRCAVRACPKPSALTGSRILRRRPLCRCWCAAAIR